MLWKERLGTRLATLLHSYVVSSKDQCNGSCLFLTSTSREGVARSLKLLVFFPGPNVTMETGELFLAGPRKRRGISPAMEVLLEVSKTGEPPVVWKESVIAPLLSL